MVKRIVCVPVLSRANYGRLKSVLTAINRHPELELKLIVGASAVSDANGCIRTIKGDGFKVDAEVRGLVEGDDLDCMPTTTGLMLIQLTTIFGQLNPDMVFVHGDRYEQLSSAIAASYTNRVLIQSEGGDVSGTIDNKVRNSITALSDIHFPVTELSRQRIITMGKEPETVFVVGSPALDLLKNVPNSPNPREEPYLLVLGHPNTTHHEEIDPLIEAVMSIPIKKVWVNSNVDAGAKAIMRKVHGLNVEFIKNLPPEEYARLLYHAKCAVGNSSSFIKEGAFLGTPAVICGRREENREHGENVRFVDYSRVEVLDAVLDQIKHGRYSPDNRFGDGNSGEKIADILSRIDIREKNLCLS